MKKLRVYEDGSIETKNKGRWFGNELKSGYILCFNPHNKKMEYVHRLVALRYCINPKPEEYHEVNHIDGNKTNNHYTNIEWCSRAQNIQHAYDTGLKAIVPTTKGEKVWSAKLKEEQVLEIRRLAEETTITRIQLSEKYNVTQHCISRIVNRKSWKHI